MPKRLCVQAARNKKERSAKKLLKASLRDRASEGAANQTSFSKGVEKAVQRTALQLALEGERRITSADYGFVRSGTSARQKPRDRMFAGQKERSKKVLTVSCYPDLMK